MNIRRVIGKYLLLDLFTNWISTVKINNLLFINITEFVTSALRPSHKGTNLLCYDSKVLKQIYATTKHDNRYKTLNFGTTRIVHELQLNKNKQKQTSRIQGIPQQGPNFIILIHIEPITLRGTFFNNSIKIATGNVHSLKNKEQTLLHKLIELDINIMLVTETWLTKDVTVWLDSCVFNKDTYRIESDHHQTGKGGGLALIHRSTSDVKQVAKGQTRSFEYATWSLMRRRKTITITGIYHPPPKDKITNGMFIDNITDHVTFLLPATTNNVILGDFTMHVNDMSSYSYPKYHHQHSC